MPFTRSKVAVMEILSSLNKIDRRLFARVFSQGERAMVIPMSKALSRSGDGYLHVFIPLLFLAVDAENLTTFVSLLALSLIVERSLYWCLKNSLKRRRPEEAVPGFRSLITASDKFSFPSGHSSGAFLLATALVVVYGGPVTAMYLWASGVALSRIMLGVHFPGDTVAGGVMGAGVVLFIGSQMGLV